MALSDREQIMDHIAADNPNAAIVLDEAFETKAQQARHSPNYLQSREISRYA
ncbi:hypothetical protein [Pseudomonas rubra]|uniref:hypothetical protein n=1 Tax=Pseudomonas rubra TaxID=2942627 RepID=UPI0030826678